MIGYVSPEAQRSLSNGIIVDPEPPSMTPYQAGLVPRGGFPLQPDIVMSDYDNDNDNDDNFGIYLPDIVRSLDGVGYMDYFEGQLADEVIEPATQVIPLGDTIVLNIPLRTWLLVGSMAAAGGSLGAYLLTRDTRAMIGGTLGGLVGGLAGVALVGMMRPKVSQVVQVPQPTREA